MAWRAKAAGGSVRMKAEPSRFRIRRGTADRRLCLAACTPGFRPGGGLHAPSFRPFSRVSIKGLNDGRKVPPGRLLCRGFVDRGKGAGSPQTSAMTRAESVVEGTPSRGMAAGQSYPSLEALLKLEASLKHQLCGHEASPQDGE